MTKFIRAAVASAALAGFGIGILATSAPAAASASALAKCYDAVVAACNKKPDHAVNPCVNSGLDQCDAEHSAAIQLPGSQIDALRSTAMRKLRIE